jgi:hypothetical protein
VVMLKYSYSNAISINATFSTSKLQVCGYR